MWIPPTSGNAWQACTTERVAQETVSKTTQEDGWATAEECPPLPFAHSKGGVAAITSSIVVSPSATRSAPARRRGRMPSCTA